MKLNKVPLKSRYFHRFKNDLTGELFEVETTKQEYKDLGKLNPTNPTLAGHTWLDSIEQYRPEVGEYMVEGDQAIVRIDDGEIKHGKVPLEDIVSDELTTKGVADLDYRINKIKKWR